MTPEEHTSELMEWIRSWEIRGISEKRIEELKEILTASLEAALAERTEQCARIIQNQIEGGEYLIAHAINDAQRSSACQK